MAKNNIEIKGLDKFQKALRSSPEISAPFMQEAIVKSIASIQREAVPRTPLDTGDLRKSYRPKFKLLTGILGFGSPGVKYAYIQHEGNFRHPRGGERKFLDKAVKAQKTEINKIFKKALGKIMGAIALKSKF